MNKLGDFFTKKDSETSADDDKKVVDVVKGRIIKLHADGWGFISSKDIPFTRIFFHWTSLRQDTKKFLDLKIGMIVEFIPATSEDKGTRAIRIKVMDVPPETPTENPAPATTE